MWTRNTNAAQSYTKKLIEYNDKCAVVREESVTEPERHELRPLTCACVT